MKIKSGKYEFSKLIGWIVGSLVLIVFLNFAASFLGIYMVSTQAKDAGDEMIRSGVEELNRILSTAEQALAGELSYDTDITRLSVAGGALNLDYLETYSIERNFGVMEKPERFYASLCDLDSGYRYNDYKLQYFR